jgi:hypothetical protein
MAALMAGLKIRVPLVRFWPWAPLLYARVAAQPTDELVRPLLDSPSTERERESTIVLAA